MVQRYDGRFTCAPNFAFALLLRKLEEQACSADWSSMHCIVLGGEPTEADVVHRICGAAKDALATVRIVERERGDDVASPPALLPDGNVGRIWVRTPLMASGYWNKSELSKTTFENELANEEGPWLDTGDLAVSYTHLTLPTTD